MRTLIILLASVVGLQAATVRIALTNYFADTFPSNTVLQLFYTNTPTFGSDGKLITGVPRRVTAPFGYVETNLLAGQYTLTVAEPKGIAWKSALAFTVPDDTNSYDLSTLAASGFSSSTVNPPFVQQLVAGNGISLSPTNGKGTVTIASTFTGAATNVVWPAATGSFLSATTNGLTVTFEGVGIQPTNANLTLWGNYNPSTYTNGLGTGSGLDTNNPIAFGSDVTIASNLTVQGAMTVDELNVGTLGVTNGLSGTNLSDGTISTNKMDATAYAAFIGGGTGSGDVTAAGDNVFTGSNTFTGALTVTGGTNRLGTNTIFSAVAAGKYLKADTDGRIIGADVSGSGIPNGTTDDITFNGSETTLTNMLWVLGAGSINANGTYIYAGDANDGLGPKWTNTVNDFILCQYSADEYAWTLRRGQENYYYGFDGELGDPTTLWPLVTPQNGGVGLEPSPVVQFVITNALTIQGPLQTRHLESTYARIGSNTVSDAASGINGVRMAASSITMSNTLTINTNISLADTGSKLNGVGITNGTLTVTSATTGLSVTSAATNYIKGATTVEGSVFTDKIKARVTDLDLQPGSVSGNFRFLNFNGDLTGWVNESGCHLPWPANGPSLGSSSQRWNSTYTTLLNATNIVAIGTITGNGSGITNLQGNAFGASTPTVTDNGTNWVANLGSGIFKLITATNNINFAHATNSGVASVFIDPNGTNRTVSFPTNWVVLSTNGLTKSGSLYSLTVTSGYGGLVLSLADWGRGTAQQSNVVVAHGWSKNF